jgi:hypothetical protein
VTLAAREQNDPRGRDRALHLRISERELHSLTEDPGPVGARFGDAICVRGARPGAQRSGLHRIGRECEANPAPLARAQCPTRRALRFAARAAVAPRLDRQSRAAGGPAQRRVQPRWRIECLVHRRGAGGFEPHREPGGLRRRASVHDLDRERDDEVRVARRSRGDRLELEPHVARAARPVQHRKPAVLGRDRARRARGHAVRRGIEAHLPRAVVEIALRRDEERARRSRPHQRAGGPTIGLGNRVGIEAPRRGSAAGGEGERGGEQERGGSREGLHALPQARRSVPGGGIGATVGHHDRRSYHRGAGVARNGAAPAAARVLPGAERQLGSLRGAGVHSRLRRPSRPAPAATLEA